MGVLAILILSTLPYFHDIITTKEGLKPWVPVIGIEALLTGQDTYVLGFSKYRVFLYTFLIYFFAMVGFIFWYSKAKAKYYGYALLVTTICSVYHVLMIILKFRKTVLNDPEFKMIGLGVLMVVAAVMTFKKHSFSIKKVLVILSFFIISLMAFLHNVITNSDGLLSHIPNLGIEAMLTDSNGLVRGLNSYRLLLYLFGLYLFAHIPWIGSFMDSRGSRIRPFLLVPSALSLYQVIVILMSWRETEFNSPSINLYITLGLSIIVAVNFFYNNKVSPDSRFIQKGRATIKSNESENQ